MLLRYYVKNKNWRRKEKTKRQYSKVTISNYILSLYPMYPHPDSLNEFQAKRFLNWTDTRLLEEVAWTLREHSTKAKQQVSWDYYLILEISWEENLTDSGKFANSWKVSWSKKIWKTEG